METTGAKSGDLSGSGSCKTILGLVILAGGIRLCLNLDGRRSYARYHRSNNIVARLVRTRPRRQGAEMQQGLQRGIIRSNDRRVWSAFGHLRIEI